MTPSTRWPETRAPRGLVVSPHALASEAGLAVLRSGGNAVDAAIAAATTLAYPHMNGVGGDNSWLLYDSRHGELLGLNAAGRSAAAVDGDQYRARYGVTMPTRGGAAALTVPGAVSDWWEAHRFSREKLGSPIAWKTLFAAATGEGESHGSTFVRGESGGRRPGAVRKGGDQRFRTKDALVIGVGWVPR